MFLAFVVLSLKLKTCTRAAHDFSGIGVKIPDNDTNW